MIKFFILACVFAYGYATIGDTCKTEDECSEGECCQILSQFMVVSKRDVVSLNLLKAASDSGTCQLYHKEGEGCSSFEKINGYCGCGPGLQCYTRQEPDAPAAAPALSKRVMMAPDPGYHWVFSCETNQTIAAMKGTCQLYHKEGEGCSSFEKINGYCGCGPNLQCYSRQEPNDDTSKRMMVAPDPGYHWVFTCETNQTIAAMKGSA